MIRGPGGGRACSPTRTRWPQVVARYNLLAVPVVDAEGRLVGIVTVDDAMDTILPTAWKKRLPRLFARS